MKHFPLVTFMLVTGFALPQNPAVSHRKNVVCELAAPRPGTHWVCSNSETCDCHLEGTFVDGDEKVLPPTVAPAPSPVKVCQHAAPPAGSVLNCDADCKCEVRRLDPPAGPAIASQPGSANCDHAATPVKVKKKKKKPAVMPTAESPK